MTNFFEIVCGILNEENVSGSGGSLGTFDTHAPGVSINYSPEDHRLPYASPHLHRRNLNSGENITSSNGKKRHGTRKKNKRKKQR